MRLTLLCLAFLVPAAAQGGQNPETPPAGQTAWMSLTAAEDLVKIWRKDGRTMTAIECRPDLTGDADLSERTQFRLTSTGEKTGLDWTWRELPALDLPRTDKKLKSEGYRRVTEMEFARQPSGQKRVCALWHK